MDNQEETPVRRKFSLKRKEEEFDVELKDGTEKTYIMKELDGDARGDYMNGISNRVQKNSQGASVGIKDFKGLEANLLTRCVFDPDTQKMITHKEVQSWASSGLDAIHTWAKEFNALDEEADKNAKNDSSGNT